MKLPPEISQQWGTSGETQVGVSGNLAVLQPDDLGVGRGSFEGAYAGANGNLDDLNKKGSQILFGVNVLGDSHASVSDKAIATATVVAATAAVEGVALTGLGTAGVLTAATIANVAPVLGQITAAFIIMVAVVFEALQALGLWASANQPVQDRPIDQALRQIPQAMTLPGIVVDATTIGLCSNMARWCLESIYGQPAGFDNSLDASAYRLEAAHLFGNDAGKALEAYNAILDVWGSPRFALAHGEDFAGAYAAEIADKNHGGVGFGAPSYAQVAVSWNGAFPAGISPANAVLAYVCGYLRAGRTDWRGAAYAAVYQILLTRAWAYKAAGLAVPDAELTTQGFILDLCSQYPVAKLNVASSRVTSGAVAVLLVKDLRYYLDYYLRRLAP